MKTVKNILRLTAVLIAALFVTTSCDNNDDLQNNPGTPSDGFTLNTTLYETPNAYIAIDQSDRDNSSKPDYYTFFFSNGRISDTWGDQGIGYAHAFSTNTTQLVKLQVFESSNPSLATGNLTAGSTYIASMTLTTSINGFGVTNSGFSQDSFIAYSLQAGSTVFGTINGLGYTQIPEVIGLWSYASATAPTITINAITIDTTTPANSTIDVDYTFQDTTGNAITGHYAGTLGIILD